MSKLFILLALTIQFVFASTVQELSSRAYPDKKDNGTLIVNGKTLKNGDYRLVIESSKDVFVFSIRDGMLHGHMKLYYADGSKRGSASFVRGKQVDKQIEYFQSGKIKKRTHYRHGKKHGPNIDYFKNGEISTREYYLNGKKEGLSVRYYENGETMRKHNYKNGQLHGLDIKYFKDGTILSKGNFKDGKLHGSHIDYHKNGKIRKETNYENGNIIQTIPNSQDNTIMSNEMNLTLIPCTAFH